ncbi:MAG: SRPBCC family protein [Kordiimonadaceae bacterium]|nr:SRPBCC family protein [Kordiimonadaceae bacterium]
MHIEHKIEISEPIETVWDQISDLTGIQDWTKTVNSAHFHTDKQRGIGAGRTCDVKGFGKLVENVLEWSEGESYRLSLEGLPSFVKEASGGWRLEKAGDNRTIATTFIDMETRYWPFGVIMEKVALGPQFNKVISGVQKEFKNHVEAAGGTVKTA